MESFVEKLLYRSRWLLAPIYLGLSLAVIALGIMFFKEVYHLFVDLFFPSVIDDPKVLTGEAKLVLSILSLIDISMVGGLLVMVMMSGYENFVSALNVDEDEEKLGWLGTMDSSSLKAKIAASIVAISSIHLLKMFMNVDQTPNDKLVWYVVIHMTFVVSAFMMGYLDTKTKH